MVTYTKNDLARYPFLKEAADYVQKLDFKIEDLADPELTNIVSRAEERVEEAILFALATTKTRNEEIEILSFPVAIMLIIAVDNSYIKKRYALAEAKRAYNEFKLETKARLISLAQAFNWQITADQNTKSPFEFTLGFTDYLRNTTHLREKKWKLTNRLLSKGNVYVTIAETARLLSEEIRNYIERRVETKETLNLPEEINRVVEKIKQLSLEKIGSSEMNEIPKAAIQAAFPPCIQALQAAISTGRHLSHVGRFTLTSFLVNVGITSDVVTELFRNFSDYNKRMTRYQVEHIAGERGSRTRYIPPKCDTLQTHGVCINPDFICRSIRHPLAYYRRKARQTA